RKWWQCTKGSKNDSASNIQPAVVENGGTVDVHLHMKTRISLLSATTTCHLQPLQLNWMLLLRHWSTARIQMHNQKMMKNYWVKQDVAQ
uniref:Uncharacterized protein n=1 Tax=Ditylenchus dipsaci TaxID=166011 RepID=A0A915DCT1_9BILA